MPKTFNVGAPSLFVTSVAWLAIVLAVGAALLVGLQHAELASLLVAAPHRTGLPLVTGWLLRGMPWVLGGAALLALLLAASGVGLLMRLDWARRVFIGLAGLAIAAFLCGLWLQHELLQLLVQDRLGTVTLPPAALGLFGGLLSAAQAMAAVVTLAVALLLAWVIGRLRSEAVRQEFA